MGLHWNYNIQRVTLYDDGKETCGLEVSLEDGILLKWFDSIFKVNLDDISWVGYNKASIFKKGFIAFYDEDDEMLYYDVEGESDPVPLGVEFRLRDKDTAELIIDLLRQNGFEIVE